MIARELALVERQSHRVERDRGRHDDVNANDGRCPVELGGGLERDRSLRLDPAILRGPFREVGERAASAEERPEDERDAEPWTRTGPHAPSIGRSRVRVSRAGNGVPSRLRRPSDP